jgi:hypothetical protein
VLNSVGEPTDDVETGFRIASGKYTIDVIVHQFPTALAWEHAEATPEIETVIWKDLRLVRSEGNAVVGYSVGMFQPELACGNLFHP